MRFFRDTIPEVKRSMLTVGYLRKQFFCSLCDGHAQTFFDHKRRAVVYKADFCEDVIRENLDYLQFLNVLFVEFADSLLQYVQCFETDSHIYNFPFQNFLVKYKRRIHFYRKCFTAVLSGNPAFLKDCWFICNKFSLLRMNSAFDGDLPMLSRVKVALFSFLRKFRRDETAHKQAELARDPGEGRRADS